MPTEDIPEVSVAVSAFSGEAALQQCLESLAAYASRAEIVIATSAPPDAVQRLAQRFPAARFFPFPAETPGVRLRSRALAQARGRLVALIEDHCTVTPGWLDALTDAYRAGHAVIGGPIDNGLTKRIYHWALYLTEYSAYLPPLPGGPTRAVIGANAAYDREALLRCQSIWADVYYENEVHDALCAAGHGLYLAEKAVVCNHLAMTLGEAMAHLYSGGRHFGGYRKAQSSAWRRLFWVAASPAVPFLMLTRIFRRVAARRPSRLGTVAVALPFIACLALAWSLGEAVGYVAPLPARQAEEQPAIGLSR